MTKISNKDVEQVAYLARLEVSASEVKKYQAQLDSILDYIELIKEADVIGVDPMINVTGLVDVIRGDTKEVSDLTRDEILINAPDKKDGYIKVKPILD